MNIIHQIQVSYSSQEDRLIMNINSKNNEEIRLFLTQRIAVSFLDMLNQTINHSLNNQPDPVKPLGKESNQNIEQQMKQQIQHQNIINESDYDTPFNAGDKFPIGEVPILVEKITINAYENNNITLIFTSATGQDVNLGLNSQLLHNISDLLIKVIPSTGWKIGLSDKINSLIPKEKDKLTLH